MRQRETVAACLFWVKTSFLRHNGAFYLIKTLKNEKFTDKLVSVNFRKRALTLQNETQEAIPVF